MSTNQNPLVSVIMITYDHEKYIGQAIEGGLMQKANFDIELIIANDNSPDNTDELIKEILKNNISKIHIDYTNHDSNKGMMSNFIWALHQARGKYIALCDGDDYWTDPLKLQKQVDFLESNPDFSICFHKVNEIDMIGNRMSNQIVKSQENEQEYNLFDLAKENFIHTPSVVFRKSFDSLPVWFQFSSIGDYPLYMICAERGKIKYLPNAMANYRIGSGAWSSKPYKYRVINSIFTLNLLINYFKNNNKVKQLLTDRRELLLDTIYDSTEIKNNSKSHLNKFKNNTIFKLIKKIFK